MHVAGDFADLHAFTLKQLDHDVMTLSECTVAIVPHDRLQDITERDPCKPVGRAYWFATNVDAAIHREMALSLGQRSALSRMAHLFCELYVRLEVVGRANRDGFNLPLTQRELSECLGLTVVHANRTLQELRRRKLVEFEKGKLTVLDRRGLEASRTSIRPICTSANASSSPRCFRSSRRSAQHVLDRPGDNARHFVAVQAGNPRSAHSRNCGLS